MIHQKHKLTPCSKTFKPKIFIYWLIFTAIWLGLVGCADTQWNSPYPVGDAAKPIFYSSFSERPKHLDPARSYSENEWAFISQIYEPPLQYHFLKRPYSLTTLTATQMPKVQYLDSAGQPLPKNTARELIAFTEYQINIQPSIRYQPHPAFALSADGDYVYWPLTRKDMADRFTLDDFDQVGTRELVSDDYLYQIKRLAFTPNHSPIAGLMSEHIVGFADFAEQADAQHQKHQETGQQWTDLRKIPITGIQRIDDYRFNIRIYKTYPQFMYWLAVNFFAPMPWEVERFYAQPGMAEKNLNLNWYPVGTGPFMLTENNPNLRMTLSRNPNFHGETYPTEGTKNLALLEDAGRPMPFIDKAVYSLEKEAIPRWNKFLQGYYDNSGIASDSFDQAIQFEDGGEVGLSDRLRAQDIQLNTAIQTSIFYTGFNMLDPVVGGKPDDPADQARARKLRQAIAMAVDWEEFISIFRNGRGAAAHSPLPPGIFGYLADEAGMNPVIYSWENGKASRKPISAAQRLLAEAGYPDGRDPVSGGSLVLYYDTAMSGPGSKPIMQWYTHQFEKLGIQLVIRATDYNRFQDKMLKGTAQIFTWGWNADYPDPENFFFLLYGPNSKATSSGANATNFKHTGFDQLFEQMKDMPNSSERQQLINQMIDILRVESPWLFGFYPKAFSLHHAWYGNATSHLMANNTLKYKKIDGELRARQQAAWNQPVLWPIGLLLLILLLSVIPAIRSYRAREKQAIVRSKK